MKLIELYKSFSKSILVGTVSAMVLVSGCTPYTPREDITSNYETDRPGLHDVSQILEHHGHTIVGVREGLNPSFIDENGNPIPFEKFGQSYQLDHIYSRFTILTGRNTVKVVRKPSADAANPAEEGSIKDRLTEEIEQDVVQTIDTLNTSDADSLMEMGAEELRAAYRDALSMIDSLQKKIDEQAAEISSLKEDIEGLKARIAELEAEVSELKERLGESSSADQEKSADAQSSVSGNSSRNRVIKEIHYNWGSEKAGAFLPSRELADEMQRAFNVSSRIRIISYQKKNSSESEIDAAALRGENIKKYFMKLGVPQGVVSANILRASGSRKSIKAQLRSADIRFIE